LSVEEKTSKRLCPQNRTYTFPSFTNNDRQCSISSIWSTRTYTFLLIKFFAIVVSVINTLGIIFLTSGMFAWLVADGWCWFVLREKYCWLVAGGWFVPREKYCWLVADKPSEQGVSVRKYVYSVKAIVYALLLVWHNCTVPWI
jgi:hypothetical protein